MTSWPARYATRIAPRPQTVVIQATSFCNLDCRYCYLPHRNQHQRLSARVAEATARSVAELVGDAPERPIGLVWHAGEPLALGRQAFTDLMTPFEPLRASGRLRHHLQTNATLITDAWCDFLRDYDVRVGVSIDGPAGLNGERIDRRGRPVFERIMRGIGRLRDRGIPFSTISVVGQPGIDRPEQLLDFLSSLGGGVIGFNLEETEGINTGRPTSSREQATEFWRRVVAWSRQHPETPVRELQRLADYLQLLRAGQHDQWAERGIDPIPTVSASGDVVLLSPELAGTSDPAYNDFRVGNVTEQSIATMLESVHGLRYVREFLTGLDECEATCEFFDFCRGAQAGNRYFENGSLATTETNFCRVSQQALVMAVANTAREEEAA